MNGLTSNTLLIPEEELLMVYITYIEKWLKKMFRPAFGCAQHPKAGRNTQQTY